MKHVIPAAVVLSLAAAGFAQAQTSNSTTGATTTTNSVGTGSSATNGSSAGTTSNPARNGANTAGSTATMGSPNTADTNAGRGTGLGTAPVGSPNANTATTRTDNRDANTNNAVNTRPQNNPGAPHPGANSFTEGQARSRIQDKGFSQVTDLKKDNQGIWRGHAMKDGKQTSVALDFQGNVVAQ